MTLIENSMVEILLIVRRFYSCDFLLYVWGCSERGGARWETALKDDIIGECNQFGGVLHIYVDRDSEQGNVYVKCPAVSTAISAVNALHGRFYAGRCAVCQLVSLLHLLIFMLLNLKSS